MNDRRAKLTPKEVAKAIGLPVKDWPGRCHEIAGLCLVTKLVVGRLRYGMWLGKIHPDAKGFGGRSVTHHGWVEVEPSEDNDPLAGLVCQTCGHVIDEHAASGFFKPCLVRACEGCDDFVPLLSGAHVFDPTRWVFEHVEPYIFLGEDRERYYDPAGDRMRASLMLPYPTKPVFGYYGANKPGRIEAEAGHIFKIAAIIAMHGGPVYTPKTGAIELPSRGIHWLANLPVSVLGEDTALALYQALDKIGQGPSVPIDNRETVMGDGFYGHKKTFEKSLKKRLGAKRKKTS